jgi:FemAB-related protein (PEP-CTERM system-associated)
MMREASIPLLEQVIVRKSTARDQEVWDKYVFAHSEGTVFHLFCWAKIIRGVHGHADHFLIAESAGEVVGVLPLCRNKTVLFGDALVSTPFCPYGGILANDNSIARKILQFARDLRAKINASHLEIRSLYPLDLDEQSEKQELYFTFRKQFSNTADSILESIPRKQRAMVRKGISNGLVSRIGTLDEFFDAYSDNIHRHGTPGSPKAFFRQMKEALGDNAEFLVVLSPAGKVVSAVFTLYFKNEALPFYAGDYPEARSLAANDFKYYALMNHAAARGSNLFDFGRSKLGTGPFSFKKNWGFEPIQLYYYYWDLQGRGIPENNPLNPKFQLAIRIWRSLPRWAVKLIGPLVVKGLG